MDDRPHARTLNPATTADRALSGPWPTPVYDRLGRGGVSRSATTYATTTATITSGDSAMPSALMKSVARSTAVNGSPSMTAVIAPMPIAAPAIIGRPGRCERAIPPTAPMNMAGNTGPPRKQLSARA